MFYNSIHTMNKITLLLLFLVCFSVSKAQEFALGAKVGLTSTQVIGSDFKSFSSPDNYNGFLLGAYTRIGLVSFFIQPEILFRNLNFSVANNNNSSASNKLSYIDVPVLFGKKILKLVRVSAGPNFQFLVDKDVTISNASGTVDPLKEGDFKNFVLGAQAGLGVDVWKLSFDVRYDFSLTQIGAAAQLANNSNSVDFSTRASMLQFSIGYRFIKLP